MLRGACTTFSPRYSNMVAGNGLSGVDVNPIIPSDIVPCFTHPVPNPYGFPVSYADAVVPGYGLGDPAWCVLPPCMHHTLMCKRRAVFMSKKPRTHTKTSTMPYCHVPAVKPHGFGLPRTSTVRPKKTNKSRSPSATEKKQTASSGKKSKPNSPKKQVTLNAKSIESYTTKEFEKKIGWGQC